MSKKKLTDISKIKDEKVVLTNQSANLKNHPEINFKYLWKCNVCCFNGLSKYNSKHKEEKVFDQLQKFLFEVDQCSSLEEVITQYTSSKGSKVDLSNDFVKRIKDKFEKAYPQEKALLESDIIHMHLKRNGKEKFVLFGVDCGSVFYVLAFNPGHDFDKRA